VHSSTQDDDEWRIGTRQLGREFAPSADSSDTIYNQQHTKRHEN